MEGNQSPSCFCCQHCTRAVSTFPKMFCLCLLPPLFISPGELTVPRYSSTKLYSMFCRGGSDVSTFFLQISYEWTIIESTGLNPSAKNILHVVNMAVFNIVSILKYFHVHDHILLYLKLNLYTLKNY